MLVHDMIASQDKSTSWVVVGMMVLGGISQLIWIEQL